MKTYGSDRDNGQRRGACENRGSRVGSCAGGDFAGDEHRARGGGEAGRLGEVVVGVEVCDCGCGDV